ncbi:MAG: hypothetical protein E6L03_10505 [Thaumarchaeota archaeon]|nr:MAG: hypothetical protein E6L03_10505 [Nitrososphaerota archaeon]
MIVCEKEFERPDPQDANYSMAECDIYAWIPADKVALSGMQSHRLSLRKNLKTGEFEVYRLYNQEHIIKQGSLAIVTYDVQSGKPVEIAFSSKDFIKALDFCNEEWDKWHYKEGEHRNKDVPCEHEYPQRSMLCPVK